MYAWSRGDLADRAPPIIAGQTDAAAAAVVLGGKKRTRRAAGALVWHGRERERGSYCENVPHCYRPSSSSWSPGLPAFRSPPPACSPTSLLCILSFVLFDLLTTFYASTF
ncbi:hypothetical protein ALC60_02732 [Trachymyrmex zeteki]|uniref:Uncharacterized protein n=1 Tax=Mycetomoellerius zeteki TaxID=64791 RepID=A0A151XD61_9HYME|nr:hypothetical protein ALC60_02732 [Trachymyrmex zeteki]